MIKLITQALKVLGSVRDSRTGGKGKDWYRSKTLWVNFLTLWGIVSLQYFGIEFNGELLAGALAVVNYLLRLITNSPAGFYDEGPRGLK